MENLAVLSGSSSREHREVTGYSPAVGAFIRPVSNMPTAYCFRVDRVHQADADGPEVLECTRFGLTGDNMPIRDGQQNTHWIDSLRRVAEGVWRDDFNFGGHPRWMCCPPYYRLMKVQEHGQQDLFC